MNSSLPRPSILIVDDEESFVEFAVQLGDDDYRWFRCYDFADAEGFVHDQHPDVLLLDIGFPDNPRAGFEILAALETAPYRPPVIILTRDEDRTTIVEAFHCRADDYICKCDLELEPELLIQRIERQLDRCGHRNRELGRDHTPDDPYGGMVVADPLSQQLHEQIRLVAPTDFSVLIYGETGTGKELIANRLHALSRRAKKPFRARNCAAFPDDLLESELFGSEPGGYTGATTRQGEFELASGGTLFLDEIGEASQRMQSKLRRVLENGDYQRVGGAEILYANVRLISATNREPRQAMSDGQLDEDFFYRIADYELHVPPLRERKGDILPLAYHFLAREAARQDKPTPVLTQQLENTLLTYHWPGNVRQLRQEMRRAILHAKGHEIGIGIFLANRHREHFASANLQEVKQVLNDDLERRMITTTLRRCGGNVSQAAQILGYARPHLYRLMKKHGINPKEFRGQG